MLQADCEIIWAKINISGCKKLYIAAYYKPDVDDENSLNELAHSLQTLSPSGNENVIIAGDFNFPGINWPQKSLKEDCRNPTLHSRFIELIDDYSLTQIIEKETRGKNILDLILTNNPTTINRWEVMPGISDHDCCFAEINLHPSKNTQKPRKIPLYRKANWPEFRKHLIETQHDIDSMYENESVETIWTFFCNQIVAGTEKHIPHKMCKAHKPKPWITSKTMKLMKKRDKHYSKRKESSKYKQLKKEVQKNLRQDYWNYIEKTINPTENGQENNKVSKKFWTYIKNNKTDKSDVAPLKDNGLLHSDPKQKAQILNKQFHSVFNQDVPLNEHILPKSSYPEMNNINITEKGVLKLLKNLKPHKAPGPDNITPMIYRELAEEIAPCLTKIFRKSYETGKVPNDWKQANVCPIFKKGEKYVASNYRPVSLTCIASKLMEHIITSNIMAHANSNNILYDLQHGFRSKLSCETQLIEFVNDIVNNMQKGTQTDVIVMDFSKAFDKVSHNRLIKKLDHYGISGLTNSWIHDFLSGRKQRVVVNGVSSEECSVTSGVPQGSVLGPSLFLFYINDLPNNIKSQVRLFADDTVVYLTMKPKSNNIVLQNDLDKLIEWEEKWKMEFHPQKCQTIHITRNKHPIKNKYTLHGHTLESVSSAKYLGVTITSDLKWNKHIDSITSKANKSLGFLKRNLKISSPKLKAQAYQTLVRPIVEYASTVWDPHHQTQIDKIEKIQRRAARYVNNRYHNTSSVTEMLNNLQWRSLQLRRVDARLCMLYKIVHGHVLIPHQTNLIPVNRISRYHNTNSFQIPSSKTEYHLYSFYPRTIRLWNLLPNEIICSPTLDHFKNNINRLDYNNFRNNTLCTW